MADLLKSHTSKQKKIQCPPDDYRLIVVCGPSGVGKSTLVQQVLANYKKGLIVPSVSYTTRPARNSETNHVDYHFISQKEFIKLKKQNLFAEWAYVYGYYYGTSLTDLYHNWSNKKVVITDLDIQGADTIKKCFPRAFRVFILPPSLDILQKRILHRKQNTEKERQTRQKLAQIEIQKAKEFDCQVINQNLSVAVKKLKKYIDQYLSQPS